MKRVSPFYLFIIVLSLVACSSCSRSGKGIYTALFGESTEQCVKVLNSTDQEVPIMDCCIWLEFQTCPKELSRIAKQKNYQSNTCPVSDTFCYRTVLGAEPTWWMPYTLADDSIIVLKQHSENDPNHACFLLFSKDSTHAFYCDFAD